MNYYLTLGSDEDEIGKIKVLIEQALDLKFTERTSDYRGEYLLYKGDKADYFIIEKNFNIFLNSFIYEEWKEHAHLIKLGIFSGRTDERLKKFNNLKKALVENGRFNILKEEVNS